MIIKTIYGKALLKTDLRTIGEALEYAVQNEISMAMANLRGANLAKASLDGLHAPGACLWGAKLNGADIGLANLRGCDFRCADFSGACLAESDLSGADARGAYFSRTLFNEAILERTAISCPSIWECDLGTAKSVNGMIYSHRGEIDIHLVSSPVIIRGFSQRIVLLRGKCLWGNEIYDPSDLPAELQKTIFLAEHELRLMHNANDPIPKIDGCSATT